MLCCHLCCGDLCAHRTHTQRLQHKFYSITSVGGVGGGEWAVCNYMSNKMESEGERAPGYTDSQTWQVMIRVDVGGKSEWKVKLRVGVAGNGKSGCGSGR